MNLYDPVYQRELRERVLQKIIDDWSVHFSHHGAEYVNLNAIKSQNRFVEDVADVIEKTVAAQLGTTEASQIAPSKYFFRRLFFEYNPDERWQKRTRRALCLYVGYTDWREFVDAVRLDMREEPVTVTINQIMIRPRWLPTLQTAPLRLNPVTVAIDEEARPRPWRVILLSLLGLGLLAGLVWWGWQQWQNRPFSPEQLAGVRFGLVRVEGQTLPQTLVLAYDVRSLGVDSVVVDFGTADREYNHQPGDLDRKVFQQLQGQFTYPFWKPAFAVIRLIARNQVVATLHHTTRTDGWAGWTNDAQNGNTQALLQHQIQADGSLKVPVSVRRGQPIDFYSKLVNQRPYILDADSLDLQIRLKNPFAEGGISCFDPMMGVRWGGNDEQCLIMQTTRIGCGVGAFIRLGTELIRNGEHDLSGFGADFESWRTLRITTRNKLASFYVDGALRFQYPYRQNLGSIQALEVTFKGSGSVDWVRLANSQTGQVVYFEDFK